MNYLEFSKQVGSNVLALDQTIDKNWASKNLTPILQGNLDNFLLAFGDQKEIEKEVLAILESFGNRPFIFNLGHGILPETPIANVELVLKLVRK